MVQAIQDAAPNDLIANELIIVNEVLAGAIAIFTEELDRIGNSSNVNENVGSCEFRCTIVFTHTKFYFMSTTLLATCMIPVIYLIECFLVKLLYQCVLLVNSCFIGFRGYFL